MNKLSNSLLSLNFRKIVKFNEYWKLYDIFFERTSYLPIKRKFFLFSLLAAQYTILWDHKVIHIFGLKKSLSHPETLSPTAIVLIFAKANLLSSYYWNFFNVLFEFFFKWAKGIIYPQKTYSNLDANVKLNIFNKILRC